MRDSKNPKHWLKCTSLSRSERFQKPEPNVLVLADNDSQVSDADPEEEVFRETSRFIFARLRCELLLIALLAAGDSNAYFLVYCRRDRLCVTAQLLRFTQR